MISNHVRKCLKAYTALVGMVATALLAQHSGGTVGMVLTDVAAVATVVGVWAMPNTPPEKPTEAPSSPSQPPAE